MIFEPKPIQVRRRSRGSDGDLLRYNDSDLLQYPEVGENTNIRKTFKIIGNQESQFLLDDKVRERESSWFSIALILARLPFRAHLGRRKPPERSTIDLLDQPSLTSSEDEAVRTSKDSPTLPRTSSLSSSVRHWST